jgi:hypothetical protein
MNSTKGLSIDSVVISRISGPVSAYFLRPTTSFLNLAREQGFRAPLFLLLGDIHESNKGRCAACSCSLKPGHPCSVTIDGYDFFELLGKVSTPSHPVHVYLEWFFSKELKDKLSSQSPVKVRKYLEEQIEHHKQSHIGPLNRIYANNFACFFPDWKYKQGFQSIFQDYCPNKTIQWQHVDLRKIISTYSYGIVDPREEITLIGKYIYEGLLDWILMEEPFRSFRTLLLFNPRQSAIELIAGFWKYGLTKSESKVVCKSILKLLESPEAFSSFFFDWENEMFSNRSILSKQVKKQSPYLQDINRLREWYTLILQKYHSQQMKDWIEQTKEVVPQPLATYQKAKKYIYQFFSVLDQAMDPQTQQTSNDILNFSGWNSLELQKPNIENTDYIQQLLEDIGLAMTCSFVDMGILLRTFKIPVHRLTQESQPQPFLSVAYFGDDHMKTILNLLVHELKLYELVPGSVDHVKENRRSEKGLRCLSLQHVQWNLRKEAQRIGVQLPSFPLASSKKILKSRQIKSKRNKSHRRSNKIYRRQSI